MAHALPPRLELFSDAVFAIIITIMVLELRPPVGHELSDLVALWPIAISYVLSFVYLIIYWNNHHHLMSAMKRPTAGIMWSNAHLLFWLSLIPFSTAWLGESHGAYAPALVYGINLLLAAIAYFILQSRIIKSQGSESPLQKALGNDIKGKLSPLFYVFGIVGSFFNPLIGYFWYVVVALMWIVPDRRIESLFEEWLFHQTFEHSFWGDFE